MANFTETTNYSFKKPTVGADTDQWGTHLNETIDGVDSQLKTLADSITSQQLEQLGNVMNVTPVDDQFLRYNGTNWTAETVSIPDALNDLSNVSGTPSSGDVLTYNGSAWSPASVTSAAVADGSVTNAKLHPSLQTVIGRILVTDDDDSPTDNQILVYSTSDAEWKYADQAGSTLQTLTDVSTTGLSDGDLMTYDGTAGGFVFIDASAARTLLNVDVSGTDNSTPVTLNTTSHDYLTLTSQQITLGPIVLTDDVSGTLPIANGGTSATTAAGARTSLGLGALATQSTITESQISDLQSYITASSTDTLTNKSGNISQWTNDSGYLTAETNDLSNVSGTLPIANGGTGATTASGARTALGLAIGTDVQAYDADTTKNDVSNTFSANQIISANTSSDALRITQTGSGNALVVEDSANPDSTPFVVDANGNVGIGESSLTALFQINRSTAISSTDITNGRGSIHLSASSNATDSTGQILNSISFSGQGGFGRRRAMIANLQSSTGFTGGDLAFYTTPSGSGDDEVFERLRIDSSGNVGIGTNSPAQKLDVSGNINATGALTLGTALAIAEGGTGATDAATARTNLDVDQAGTDNSTDCTLVTTSHDYLSIAGQAITLGPIDLAADVTGNLPYASISGTPTLGTAAAEDVGYFATAAQGTLADSAVQPGDDAADLGSGSATDGYVLTADGAGGAAWEAASGGGGGTTAYVEHSSTISDSFTLASGTNRMYIGGTTFSGTITVAGRLAIVAGPANFTGTINITGTLATV